MMRLASRSQIRGARRMLDWSLSELAAAAKISLSTVRRVEEYGIEVVSTESVYKICKTLEEHGITFLYDDELGDGIQLRDTSRKIGSSCPDPNG